MSGVVKAIKKVGRWIDDNIFQPIKDVGSWINEKIFKPVIKYAEMQVQAFLDDPIKAIATAMAAASGNPAAWMALINGVDVALEGGDIGDILEAAAIAYVSTEAGEFAGQVGDAAGEFVGDALGEAVGNVVSKVVAGGTQQAITAIADGRDPLEAFKIGAIAQGVGLALGEIDKALGGGFTTDADGNEVYVDGGYNKLPDVVKNVIQASITDLAINGEISEFTLARAVTNSVITAQAVDDFLDQVGLGDWTPENAMDNMTEGTLGTITAVIQNTVAAAASGESGSDAFGKTLVNRVVNEAVKSFKDGTLLEDVQDTFNRLTGKYTAAREQGNIVDGIVAEHIAAVEEYNEIAKQIGDDATEVQSLEDTLDAKRKKVSDILSSSDGRNRMSTAERERLEAAEDARDAAEEEFNTARAEFEDNVENVWNPKLVELNTVIETTGSSYDEEVSTYQSMLDDLGEASTAANEELAPKIATINEAVVSELAPDADWDFYAEQNGLDSKEDAIQHYLSQGLQTGNPTTQAGLDAQISSQVNGVINAAAKAIGLDASQVLLTTLMVRAKSSLAPHKMQMVATTTNILLILFLVLLVWPKELLTMTYVTVEQNY